MMSNKTKPHKKGNKFLTSEKQQLQQQTTNNQNGCNSATSETKFVTK